MKNELNNLLSYSGKALQLCHEKHGMNFCKPYEIIEGYGNFTFNSIMKIIKQYAENNCEAVMFLENKNRYRADYQKLFYVEIESCGFESVDTMKGCFDYRGIDDFWRKSDFEKARKISEAHWFIVMQKREYLTNRKTYIADLNVDRVRYKGYGNCYTLMFDKRKEVTYHAVFYGKTPSVNEVLDKSGYIRWENVREYKRKAKALKAERDKAKANVFDCTKETDNIGVNIADIRKRISEAVLSGKSANNISDIMWKLHWLEHDYRKHCNKIRDKEFQSVEAIENSLKHMNDDITKINTMIEKLNKD